MEDIVEFLGHKLKKETFDCRLGRVRFWEQPVSFLLGYRHEVRFWGYDAYSGAPVTQVARFKYRDEFESLVQRPLGTIYRENSPNWHLSVDEVLRPLETICEESNPSPTSIGDECIKDTRMGGYEYQKPRFTAHDARALSERNRTDRTDEYDRDIKELVAFVLGEIERYLKEGGHRYALYIPFENTAFFQKYKDCPKFHHTVHMWDSEVVSALSGLGYIACFNSARKEIVVDWECSIFGRVRP